MNPQPMRQQAGEFDGTTTYGSTFQQHTLPERPQFAPPPARPQARFDATTTNQDVYKAHEVQRRAAYRPTHASQPHAPFDGTTTNQVRSARVAISVSVAPVATSARSSSPAQRTDSHKPVAVHRGHTVRVYHHHSAVAPGRGA